MLTVKLRPLTVTHYDAEAAKQSKSKSQPIDTLTYVVGVALACVVTYYVMVWWVTL